MPDETCESRVRCRARSLILFPASGMRGVGFGFGFGLGLGLGFITHILPIVYSAMPYVITLS